MAFPLINPIFQFFDNSGDPLNGGLLYTYAPGTTTNKTTYTDENLSVPNANPIVLDSAGRCDIFLTDGEEYKFVLKTSAGVTLKTVDEVKSPSALTAAAIGAVLFARTAAEIAAGVTPTDYTKQPGDFLRYGASAGGSASTNATAINDCLLSNANCFCNVAGTYQVSSTINVQSNQTITLAKGVIIEASVKNWASLGLLRIDTKTNVTVQGGTFEGNKANNAAGELINVLLLSSTKVRIIDVNSNNAPSNNTTLGSQGDGFYIGGSSDPGCDDVLIEGCSANANVRQGLSIARGQRIRVNNCNFTNTSGNNPGGGIDLEANSVSDNLKEVTITNCTIYGCYYGVIFTMASTDVTMTNCTITDCTFCHLYLADTSRVTVSNCVIKAGTIAASTALVEVVSAENVVFDGNYIRGKGGVALEGAGLRMQSAVLNARITNNTFELTQNQGLLVGITTMASAITLVRVENNTFINCVDPTAAANTSVFGVTGNSGSAIYPLLISFIGNTIYDSRSAGNEADLAIVIATLIPAATQANYRVGRNFISGTAGIFASGVLPPMAGAVTWNPANLVDGAGETSPAITVTGAAIGDTVQVFPPYDLQEIGYSASVSATDTVEIRIQNETGGAIDLASGSWKVMVTKFNEA